MSGFGLDVCAFSILILSMKIPLFGFGMEFIFYEMF